MITRRIALVTTTLLAAAGAVLGGLASPAAAAVVPAARTVPHTVAISAAAQGSCPMFTDSSGVSAEVSCTGLPDNLSYFAWVQCSNNHWGFGPTEPGTSGVKSVAICPFPENYVQGGVNFSQGSCPMITALANDYAEVWCTGLPANLHYFAWVQCSNNHWGFGPTEPGTSGVPSIAFCPSSSETYLQGGFNIG